MKNRWSWKLLCGALVLFVGFGCSGIAPSRVAPDQSGDSGKKHELYKNPQYDHDPNKMD